MRRLIPLAVLALLLAVGWWMVGESRRGPSDAPRDGPDASRVVEGIREPPPPARLAATSEAPPPADPLPDTQPEPVRGHGRGRLEGRVVDAGSGQPAVGAWVYAFAQGATDGRLQTVSDADGRYELEAVPAGPVLLVVLGGGWQEVDLADRRRSFGGGKAPGMVVVEADETRMVSLRATRAAAIEVRVVNAGGGGVRGANLRLLMTPRHYDSWTPPEDLFTATTAADGSAGFDSLVSGVEYFVEADADGIAKTHSAPFRPQASVRTRVEVRLPPSRFLDLHVVSAAKEQPVSNALASRSAPDVAQQLGQRYEEWKAGEDGHVRVGPLPPGALEVEVEADGFVPTMVGLSEDEIGVVKRRVRLEAGLVIEGMVVTGEGEPIGRAWVCGQRLGQSHESLTDDEGRFRLENLAPGTWRLDVMVGNGVSDASLNAEAGRDDLLIKIDVETLPEWVLHVLDPHGRPVPRFEVATATEWTSGSGTWKDGRFELAAGSECDWIEVHCARDAEGRALGYAPLLIDLRNREGSERTIRLVEGASIAGRVLGPDGEGVMDLEMSASPSRARASPMDPSPLMFGEHAQSLTGEDGTFRLEGLGSGAYRVFVSVPSRFAPVPHVVAEAGAGGLVIHIESAVEVQPVVVGPDGMPVVRARVEVTTLRGGGLCWERTGEDGRVVLAGLGTSDYYGLEVRPPDDRPDLLVTRVRAWKPSSRKIKLGASMGLHGRTVDRLGNPVPGCMVMAFGEGESESVSAESGEDGRFVINGLPPGAARLIATRWTEPHLASSVLHVQGAAEEGITIRMERMQTLVLHLDGAPTSWAGKFAHLRPRGLPEHAVQGTTQADGTVAFQVHPNLSYGLCFSSREDGLVAWREGIRGDAGQVGVPVVAGQEVRGRVLAPKDALRLKVRVREGAVRVNARPDDDGSFLLRGLPPGAWTVRAEALTPDGTLVREVRAKTGTDVEIDLRR